MQCAYADQPVFLAAGGPLDAHLAGDRLQGAGPPGALRPAEAQTPATRTFSFAIPPQPLSIALFQYMHIMGLDLVFDGAFASTLDSPGISGTLTAAAALNALL